MKETSLFYAGSILVLCCETLAQTHPPVQQVSRDTFTNTVHSNLIVAVETDNVLLLDQVDRQLASQGRTCFVNSRRSTEAMFIVNLRLFQAIRTFQANDRDTSRPITPSSRVAELYASSMSMMSSLRFCSNSRRKRLEYISGRLERRISEIIQTAGDGFELGLGLPGDFGMHVFFAARQPDDGYNRNRKRHTRTVDQPEPDSVWRPNIQSAFNLHSIDCSLVADDTRRNA
jgi:hypothetical protein